MIIAQRSNQCSATVHPYPCMHHDSFGMFRKTEKGNDTMACKILVPLLPPLLLLLIQAPLLAQTTKVYVSVPSKSLTWFPAHLTKEKGVYRAEGLEVDFIIMKPQVALQALIAGDVGYTTALGSTMRCGIRSPPLRVVLTIADKPLFALIARPGINQLMSCAQAAWDFILWRKLRYPGPCRAAPI